MRKPAGRTLWLIVAVALLGLWLWQSRTVSNDPTGHRSPTAGSPSASVSRPASERPADTSPSSYPAFLPREAHDVLRRIADGGPFDHRQDGGVFQNREQRLPRQPRGYYREYTVETPGSDDRGARRIVTGGDPPSEYYYTQDHYRSFQRFDAAAAGAAR